MTIGEEPQCRSCTHRHDTKGRACVAFPQGIPDEIYWGNHDHRKPYIGDNGIRYEITPTAVHTQIEWLRHS